MKYILSFLFCFSLSLSTFAQQEINTTFKTQMNTTFGNLDKTKIPHGILLDFGMEFTNVPAYNGTLTDSTYSDLTSISQIYKTLLTSRIRDVSTGFVTPANYYTNFKNNRSSNFISIEGLYFKYSKIEANAIAANKITLTSNVFYDKFINSVWQNPYQECQTFAMTTAVRKHEGLNLQVKIPSAIFYSNYQSLIQSIQIDFGNGAGYVSVPLDQLVAVNYTTEGVKVWKYKLNLTNGTSLYNQSRIKILPGLDTVPYVGGTQKASSAQLSKSPLVLFSQNITATTPYAGGYGTARLTIDLALGRSQITKPLIVAEGFDLGTILNPENINGQNTYANFKNSVQSSGSSLLRSLISDSYRDYDIIYVDWNNGIDYMQRNAYALEEVIKWVNTQKALAGSTFKNVVLGQSMGGVIARYALADMEQNGLDHKTRLFISHDAPQQGANIPVSIQFMYRHLTNQYIQTYTTLFGGTVTIPVFEDELGFSNYISILDAPASRQLVSNFSNQNYTIDNSVFTAFYNELKTKGLPTSGGYPLNCKNIAISNGAECGNTQNFSPYDDLITYNWNKGLTFGGDLLSLVYMPLGGAIGGLFVDNDFFGVQAVGSLPGNSTFNVEFNAKAIPYGAGFQIYKGRISYNKKVLWVGPNITVNITNVVKNQPAGILPLDTYGGGYFSANPIAQGISMTGLYVRDRFNFIPTTSALDIGRRNITLTDSEFRMPYIGAIPPVAPRSSAFASFTTDFDKADPNLSNKEHITFNARNSDWLAGEILGGVNIVTTNCSFICSDAQITGPNRFCISENYSASNVATYFNWSITQGSNLATITAGNSTNTVTLTATNPAGLGGYITLSCYLGNYNCGYRTMIKQIWVGKPNSNGRTINGGFDNVPINYQGQLSVSSPVEGATSYNWTIINLDNGAVCGCITDPVEELTYCPPNTIFPSFKYGNTASTVTINWGNCSGNYAVNCSAVNECGLIGLNHKLVNVYNPSSGNNPCSPQLHVYPNPVKNGTIVTNLVYQGDPCNNASVAAKTNQVNEAKIYDMYSNLVLSKTYKSDEFTISDVQLKKGHYILHVTTANGDKLREIIIIE